MEYTTAMFIEDVEMCLFDLGAGLITAEEFIEAVGANLDELTGLVPDFDEDADTGA